MPYDLIVIGAGPGGYTAAIRASMLGLKTLIIEKEAPGGVCLHHGCIPTKTLLRSSELLRNLQQSASFGITADLSPVPDPEKMLHRVRQVNLVLRKGIESLFKQHGVEVLTGKATLSSPGIVKVETDNTQTQYRGNKILLATGSSPRILPGMEPDGENIWTYREALTLSSLPESLLIIGSGAIGCELAWFYRSLGVKVSLLEMLPRILPQEEPDLSEAMERSFKRAGIKILTGVTVSGIEKTGKGCVTRLKGEKETCLETAVVLSAIGVIPNTQNLGLETAGITLNGRFIATDDHFQTSLPNHYAVGDLIASPALAHVASAEGNYCAEYLAGLKPGNIHYPSIPSCIYTEPEIASAGLKEQEAQQKGIKIRTGTSRFAGNGKALALGQREGFVKLVFEEENLRLMGVSMAGPHVTEMISGLCLAIRMGATAKDIAETIHPHPTLSEAIHEAALTALQ